MGLGRLEAFRPVVERPEADGDPPLPCSGITLLLQSTGSAFAPVIAAEPEGMLTWKS
jgi:hypothetical protein